ncbi:hypothetical protein D3C71_1785470 [compost metagenome]
MTAIGKGQQPLVAGAAQVFQARIGQQPDVAVVQTLQQAILHHAVLDDMAEYLGMHTGRREMDLTGTAAIPHLHVRVRRGAPLGDAFPGAEAFKDALARRRQGADAGLERRLDVERRDR